MITAKACQDEVERLHVFFVEWFTGAVPKEDAEFSRCCDSLHPDFCMIPPSGVFLRRDSLIAGLRDAYGSKPKSFRIDIRNCQLFHQSGSTYLVRYEEWQTTEDTQTARISTVSMVESPNGLQWQHVHETWMPGLSPKEDK